MILPPSSGLHCRFIGELPVGVDHTRCLSTTETPPPASECSLVRRMLCWNSLLDARWHEGDKGDSFLSQTRRRSSCVRVRVSFPSRLPRAIDVPELKVASGEAWTLLDG